VLFSKPICATVFCSCRFCCDCAQLHSYSYLLMLSLSLMLNDNLWRSTMPLAIVISCALFSGSSGAINHYLHSEPLASMEFASMLARSQCRHLC
jgi:hypothetical protein